MKKAFRKILIETKDTLANKMKIDKKDTHLTASQQPSALFHTTGLFWSYDYQYQL